MSDTKFQLAVYRYAKARKKDPSQLTSAELQQIALAVRTVGGKIVDGSKAVFSRAKTSLGFQVPLPIYHERKARCESNRCGYLMRSVEGHIVCGHCGCGGEFMESVLKDAKEACRTSPQLWSVYVNEQRTGL